MLVVFCINIGIDIQQTFDICNAYLVINTHRFEPCTSQ